MASCAEGLAVEGRTAGFAGSKDVDRGSWLAVYIDGGEEASVLVSR